MELSMVHEEICSLTVDEEQESPAPQPSRFIARQPILNSRREIVAYELLSRTGWDNWFDGERGVATRQTLDHCVLVGTEYLTKNQLAFVNCTREALVNKWVTLLPANTTVLEILETVPPDEELVAACVELKKMGYLLALDDFEPRPEMQPLLDIANYVKVDFLKQNADQRRQIRRMMGNSRAALLAEKVETQQHFNAAREEGYKYFQGYFFCRPVIVADREISANKFNYVRLLAEMARTTLNLQEVTKIVKMEASLCYRLLRLANSALWGRSGEVTSVMEAFMLVGEDRFRMLVAVAASCQMGENQSPALTSLSLERARFCEQVAPLIGESPTEQFMLGLLSLLDAMLGVPMASIVKFLPLRSEVKSALMGATNQPAVPLCLIKGLEGGAWEPCAATAKTLNVSEEALTQIYVDSLNWAAESLASTE
jgi:EAL and modified HD-GYP domain-containing signal transduction protein